MYMHYGFGNHIYSFSSTITCVFLVLQTYFPLIYANNFWNCSHMYIHQNTNAHEGLCHSHTYFTFVSHTGSFTSMIPQAFLVWLSYLCFPNMYEVFTAIQNILHLIAIFVLLHQGQLTYSLLGRYISFFLFMTITFEIPKHMCFSTKY